MSYLIYRIDGPHGFYIGQTGRTLTERQREHIYSAASAKRFKCKAIAAAIVKYGADAFKWSVVRSGLTKEEADAMEIDLISSLKPRYNIASGGAKGNGGRLSRPVVCINTGIEYPSGAEAARELGLSQMTVSVLCNRGGQTNTGLRFRFAGGAEIIRAPRSAQEIEAGKLSRAQKLRARRYTPETIERMRAAAKKRGVSPSARAALEATRNRPVECVETGVVFEDVKAAAQAYGLPRMTIYDLIYKGHVSRTAQVSFRYAST